MSNLSKVSAKYYFIEGLKASGWCVLIQSVIILFQSLEASNHSMSSIEYAIENLLSLGIVFVILMNGVYSMYGPNWYDNIVLAMGGRRKDIFWGEIIKQFTIVFINSLLYIIVAIVSSNTGYVVNIFSGIIFAIIAGPIGVIIGFTVGKFGRYVILGVVAIAGSFGYAMAMSSLGFFDFPPYSVALLGLVASILYIVLEIWVYKLYQRLMVI